MRSLVLFQMVSIVQGIKVLKTNDVIDGVANISLDLKVRFRLNKYIWQWIMKSLKNNVQEVAELTVCAKFKTDIFKSKG